MMFFLTYAEAQQKIAANCRARRLQMGLTQAELAERAGVALPSLRRFEQHYAISLQGLLKLQAVLGGLAAMTAATEGAENAFSSIDDVLARAAKPQRQRGRRR